jgi:hypothetical protein
MPHEGDVPAVIPSGIPKNIFLLRVAIGARWPDFLRFRDASIAVADIISVKVLPGAHARF